MFYAFVLVTIGLFAIGSFEPVAADGKSKNFFPLSNIVVFIFNPPLPHFHHSFLNVGNCPENCEVCQGGPCTRYCSLSNWCGGQNTHGGAGSTDCTGCAGTFYISLIQEL